MAASAARASFGATFALTTVGTTAGTLANVGEILTLTMPTYTANTIDITNQNTTEYFKEFVVGVRDAGSVSITANYISSSSGHTSIIPNAFYDGSKLGWKISLAGTSSMNVWWGFGYITSYNVTSPPDGAVGFGITLKITGKPTGPADTT